MEQQFVIGINPFILTRTQAHAHACMRACTQYKQTEILVQGLFLLYLLEKLRYTYKHTQLCFPFIFTRFIWHLHQLIPVINSVHINIVFLTLLTGGCCEEILGSGFVRRCIGAIQMRSKHCTDSCYLSSEALLLVYVKKCSALIYVCQIASVGENYVTVKASKCCSFHGSCNSASKSFNINRVPAKVCLPFFSYLIWLGLQNYMPFSF